jgi:hypothetical protein
MAAGFPGAQRLDLSPCRSSVRKIAYERFIAA